MLRKVAMGFCLFAAALVQPNVSFSDGYYTAAPMLQSLEQAGVLDPVQDRIPINPMLVEPVETIGTYGGTWNMAMRRQRDHALLIRTMGYEPLLRWTQEWTGVVPNVAQSYEANEDATQFTFFLREGMRWSDGAPFTADDIIFWYEDVLKNPELSAAPPDWLVAAGEMVSVKKINATTVMFQFQQPYGLFPQVIAAPEGVEPTSYPKHYLSQFLPKYNPNADAEAKAAGYENWQAQFVARFGRPGNIDHTTRWMNPDLPTLNAWTLKGVLTVDEPLIAERNPFYWKIDPAGQQLPYIDRIVYNKVHDKPAAADLAKVGGVDMQARHVTNFVGDILGTNAALQTFDLYVADMNYNVISVNITHRDPELRKIFSSRDFRIGLSLGFDRNAVIEGAYGELGGVPHQAAPRPESPYYQDRLARQYIEYDPQAASEHFAKAGLTERDGQGFFLRGDGQRLSFYIDTVGTPRTRSLELASEYWRNLGLDVKIRNLDRETFLKMRENNEHDGSGWTGDGGIDVVLYPMHYFPWREESHFAVPWAYWYSQPNHPLAEEPSEAAKRQMALYDRVKSSADPREQQIYMGELLDISANELYNIGIAMPTNRFGIVAPGFRNVPKVMPASWTYPTPAPSNPEQYFWVE